MRNILLIFISSMIWACGSTNDKYYDLSGSEFLEKGKLLYEASEAGILTELEIQDSLLIILDDLGEKKFIVLDLLTGREKLKCGDKGRGPGEFFSPEFVRNNSLLDGYSSCLKLFDSNTGCFYTIDFDRWVRGEEAVLAIESIPSKLAVNSNLNLFKDKIIGGNAMRLDSGMIAIYDRKLERQNWIDYYPYKDVVLPDLYSYVYYVNMAANEATDRIIGGMTFADLLLVYNTSGKLVKSYRFSDNKMPDIDPVMKMVKPDSPIYFPRFYASPKYCYFMRKGYAGNDPEVRKKGMNIIKLDWEGNIISSYRLGEYLYGFCVDEKRGKLLGIYSEDGDIFQILEYTLK